MSDYFDDGPGEADFESSGQRRRRINRYREMEDDAWGAAYTQDGYDGNAADVEDWAAGMIDEEASRYKQRNPRASQDNFSEPNLGDNIDPLEIARRRGKQRVASDMGEGSPAMQRANRLLNRYGSNRLERMENDIESSNRYSVDNQPPSSSGSGDFLDSLFDFNLGNLNIAGTIPLVLIVLVAVLLIMLVACVGGAWITAEEIRQSVNNSSFIHFSGLLG